MIEFLSTKLFIPRPRANLVLRPRLTERLNAGLDKKLTLVAASAGFGKTTLLSEWIPQSPRCVTWLSLDAGDNDPIRFWAYFIASIQQIHPDLGAGALSQLESPQPPPTPSILTALINDIAVFPGAFATVLEDYHVIESQPIHDGLTFLINHLPKNLHLVMTTRADPPLPLARLRARDRLTELRANDLRFTVEEAAAFLTRRMGLKLSSEEIAALEARTEGWIAGLQIAALSLQNQEDIPGFIQSFSGSHRHILGYLAEEVLNQQPAERLDFLMQTSILDRLCGPLCAAVTGDEDAQAILEDLEHTNLFITALDYQGRWYRYHQLFAEVLRVRLQRNLGERLPELHRRAETWYAHQGMLDRAVSHAIAGADYETAARLIEEVAGRMVHRGASASLIAWLDAMPNEMVRTHPRLCMARAWTFHWGPKLSLDQAGGWADLALQAATANGTLDPELTGEVAALQTMIAAAQSDVARCLELARQALDDLPADSPWRSAVTFCLGTAYLESGEMASAAQTLGDALRLSQADGVQYVQLAVASFLADIQVFQGHLRRALDMYRQVLVWADPDIPLKGGVMAHAGLANVLCEQDQLETAQAHIQAGAEQLDRVGGAWAAFTIYRAMARVHQARGNRTEALRVLEHAQQHGQSTQVRIVVTLAAALRARLQLDEGDLEAAADWADNCGLSLDDAQIDHPGLREAEYLTLARVLAARGKPAEALVHLDRLIQAAEGQERTGSAIAGLVLQSSILQTQGDTPHALESLKRALTLAEPEGHVRVFWEEGKPMLRLLAHFQSLCRQEAGASAGATSYRLLAYSDRLLAAASRPAPIAIQPPEAILQPLSQRELEILRLISAGLTNQEIARTLVIAVSTVKSHINNLYGKLGADHRTQAVAIARDLGLLAG